MNTNGTNPGMSVEDYEDMAVKNSNTAKRVATGAALFVGGAAVAGGAAYAANAVEDSTPETELTTEDLVSGAEAGSTESVTTEEITHERVVYVHEEPKSEPVPEPEEPSVTWDETINVYVDGEKASTVQIGTYDDHKFALVDGDGDGNADVLGVDMNNNDHFEEEEKVYFTEDDNVQMNHETAQSNNHFFYTNLETGEIQDTPDIDVTQNEEVIYNNFEDEKTGEEYHGDYAENNPDYNPRVDVSDGSQEYLAEDRSYDSNDSNYTAELYEESVNYTAEAEEDSSYDDMMSGEEFLG